MELLDLPDELIHRIFSFLTIERCEEMLNLVTKPDLDSGLNLRSQKVSQSNIYHILRQTIYGRTLLYLNNRHCSMTGENFMTKLLFKYLSENELREICQSCTPVVAERFVLSYHFNRSSVGDDSEHDDFLDKFLDIFHDPAGQKYLSCIGNVEISIDLFNKKVQANELDILKDILASDILVNNLSYLNLNRFQRFDQSSLGEFFGWLGANLHRFKNLHTLTLSSNNITTIDNWKFPENLINLNLTNNKLVSLPHSAEFFPSSLIKLNLSCNNVTMKDALLPDGLQYLDVQLNNITKLSNIHLPPNLKVLIASGNNIMLDNDEVVKFPEQLCYLSLLRNPYLNNVKALQLNTQLKNVYIDATFQDTTTNEAITYV